MFSGFSSLKLWGIADKRLHEPWINLASQVCFPLGKGEPLSWDIEDCWQYSQLVIEISCVVPKDQTV